MYCAVKVGWAGYCEKFVCLYQNIRHHRGQIVCRYVCYWRAEMRTGIWWGNLNEMDKWEDTRVRHRGEDNIKTNNQHLDVRPRTGFICVQGQVVGCCGCVNEHSISMKCRELFWNTWVALRVQAGLCYVRLVIFWFGHPCESLFLKWCDWTSWIQDSHLFFNRFTHLLELLLFFNWFITQTIYTKCTKISYKTVPATNFTV